MRKNVFSEIFKFELVKELLSEGRVEDAKAKYPDYEDYVDFFVENDPSGNNKYLDWLMKMYVNEDYATKDLLVKYTTIFHKNISKFTKKDINQYKTWDEFEKAVLPVKEEAERREQDKKAEEGTKKLFETKDWLLVRPLSHESSCKYGAGTKWCTTMKNDKTYFERYTKEDLLLYLINKNTNTKFAFQYDIQNKDLSIYNPPDKDVKESTYKITSVKSFLELLMKGEMENLAKFEGYDFDFKAGWGMKYGNESYESEYGYNENTFIVNLRDVISEKISDDGNYLDLWRTDRFIQFLTSLGFNYHENQDGGFSFGTNVSRGRIEFENAEDLSEYLDANIISRPKRHVKAFFENYLNVVYSPLVLVKTLKAIDDNVEIYVDPSKKDFKTLYTQSNGLIKNLKDYFKQNYAKSEPSITPEEIKAIVSAFNKEIKVIKTEVQDKLDGIMREIKPSKRLLESLIKCTPEVDFYDDFRSCLRSRDAYDDFVTYQGKRKKVGNFVGSVLESSEITQFLMNYIKFRKKNNL